MNLSSRIAKLEEKVAELPPEKTNPGDTGLWRLTMSELRRYRLLALKCEATGDLSLTPDERALAVALGDKAAGKDRDAANATLRRFEAIVSQTDPLGCPGEDYTLLPESERDQHRELIRQAEQAPRLPNGNPDLRIRPGDLSAQWAFERHLHKAGVGQF